MGIIRSFGKSPSGDDKDRITRSTNYKNGEFRNLTETKLDLDKKTIVRVLWKFLFKPGYTKPPRPIPTVATDLHALPSDQPVVVWFGHSSYLIKIAGQHILVDPVFGGHASPFNFGVRSFRGSDAYSISDLPPIDLLIITHDHYDHLDHRTVIPLRDKVKHVCTSLGVSSHLVFWGYDKNKITEMDWYERKELPGALELIAAPARHFSGRTFKRNQTLWSSFILRSNEHRIYIGADSGFDQHYRAIGEKYGPFDLAILESGQYNKDWAQIHQLPEEAIQAAADLRAKLVLPVHWGKFSLAFHPWSEPVQRVLDKAANMNINVTTPMIGEPIVIGKPWPATHWWKMV